MTEAQKKELKKIEKAVVATAKKMRTKIEKEHKKVKKADIYGVKDYDMWHESTRELLWWDTKTYDLKYKIYISIIPPSLSRHRRGRTEHYYEASELSPSFGDKSKLNLNDLKSWINSKLKYLYARGTKIKSATLVAGFVQSRRGKNEDGDSLDHYFNVEIIEWLYPPWNYGDLKIRIDNTYDSGWDDSGY